jgi:hypothetical protein
MATAITIIIMMNVAHMIIIMVKLALMKKNLVIITILAVLNMNTRAFLLNY